MILEQLKQYKPYSISPGYNAQHLIYGQQHDNEILTGTTYTPTYHQRKAMEGLVHTQINDDIYFLNNQNSILFTYESHHIRECYLEYNLNNDQFMLAGIETTSHIYTLLFVAINYLYNQYQFEQFQDIYENWRSLDMSLHYHGDQWDAPEYKIVENLTQQLLSLMKEIIMIQQDYLSLHYDSVSEILEHLRLEMSQNSLMNTFFFQNNQDNILLNIEQKQQLSSIQTSTDYSLLDITPLYSEKERQTLPYFLQESIKDNEELYMRNREFLDMNDFDLIKSFKRGKTWSCLYYGPSGTGKTTKILSVAGALGLPSLKMVGSRSIDESSLFGKYVLRNGETIFEYGPLTLMMKYGGMFIFDEINMVDSDIISSLNDVLDGTKQKILDNGEIIRAHPHFRFAESMNIGYAGTNEMNISHKSRIQNKIKIAKLPIEKMTSIIVKETEIDESIAKKMASLLDAFNNVIMSEGNETTQRIDLRTLLNWANKTVDLDGDVIRASLVTVISELAEEDDDILSLEDVKQIMGTDGAAATVMSQIVHEFSPIEE